MAVFANLSEFIENMIRTNGSRMAFQVKDGWSWKQITWLDFEKEIKGAAAFLLNNGLEPGDSVIVLYPSTRQALWSEVGASLAGAVTICVSMDTPMEGIEKIVEEHRPRFLFAGGDKERIEGMRELTLSSGCISKFVAFEGAVVGEDRTTVPYEAMIKFGSLHFLRSGDELTAVAKRLSPESRLGIVSRLNGSPGLVSEPFTHGEFLAAVEAATTELSFLHNEDGAFSYLPAAAPFARLVNYVGMNIGLRLSQAASLDNFLEDVIEIHPTVLFLAMDVLEGIAGSAPRPGGLGRVLGGRARHLVTDTRPPKPVAEALAAAGIQSTVIGAIVA